MKKYLLTLVVMVALSSNPVLAHTWYNDSDANETSSYQNKTSASIVFQNQSAYTMTLKIMNYWGGLYRTVVLNPYSSRTVYFNSSSSYKLKIKAVKNGSASTFEKDALANYYTVVHLKDKEYLEYKYRKQKFLIELDYESMSINSKPKVIEKFKPIYVEKVETLYKGILKNYSIKLADGIKMKSTARVELYRNIFNTLEEYIKNLLVTSSRWQMVDKWLDR